MWIPTVLTVCLLAGDGSVSCAEVHPGNTPAFPDETLCRQSMLVSFLKLGPAPIVSLHPTCSKVERPA